MGRSKTTRQIPSRKARTSRRGQDDYSVDIPIQPYEVPPPKAKVISDLHPKNHRQQQALEYLAEKPIVFLTGSAGTGKSMLAAFAAAKALSSKQVQKVYLVRPAVLLGKSIGLLPGEIEDKMAPYFAQIVTHLTKFLGAGAAKYHLDNKTIEFQPAEYLRGLSLENCVVIVEEAQNFTHDEFETCLTRLGENCQMIFTGDQKQNDLKVESGLTTTVALINKMLQTHPEYLNGADIDRLDSGIGIVEFKPEDVVRHGLTRALVKMYYSN